MLLVVFFASRQIKKQKKKEKEREKKSEKKNFSRCVEHTFFAQQTASKKKRETQRAQLIGVVFAR